MPTKEDMRNIIDYIEEPKFKSLMLELNKSELIQFQNAIHDLGRKLSAIMFL